MNKLLRNPFRCKSQPIDTHGHLRLRFFLFSFKDLFFFVLNFYTSSSKKKNRFIVSLKKVIHIHHRNSVARNSYTCCKYCIFQSHLGLSLHLIYNHVFITILAGYNCHASYNYKDFLRWIRESRECDSFSWIIYSHEGINVLVCVIAEWFMGRSNSERRRSMPVGETFGV